MIQLLNPNRNKRMHVIVIDAKILFRCSIRYKNPFWCCWIWRNLIHMVYGESDHFQMQYEVRISNLTTPWNVKLILDQMQFQMKQFSWDVTESGLIEDIMNWCTMTRKNIFWCSTRWRNQFMAQKLLLNLALQLMHSDVYSSSTTV